MLDCCDKTMNVLDYVIDHGIADRANYVSFEIEQRC